MTERQTVDGVPVKVGDLVWSWRGHGSPRRKVATKVDLGPWWESMTSRWFFSTERAALEAAVEDQQEALAKAKRDARRAEAGIKRHRARLAEMAGGSSP